MGIFFCKLYFETNFDFFRGKSVNVPPSVIYLIRYYRIINRDIILSVLVEHAMVLGTSYSLYLCSIETHRHILHHSNDISLFYLDTLIWLKWVSYGCPKNKTRQLTINSIYNIIIHASKAQSISFCSAIPPNRKL